jgi:hypothetical protein
LRDDRQILLRQAAEERHLSQSALIHDPPRGVGSARP